MASSSTTMTLLPSTTSKSTHQIYNGGSMPFPSGFSSGLTGKFETNSHAGSSHVMNHQMDHDIPLHRSKREDCGFLHLLPQFPLIGYDDHDRQFHGHRRLKGPDSRSGITAQSDSVLDSTYAVQTTVSKIRPADEGPLWHIVRVLRDNWNITLPDHHHTQNQIDSHNTKSIEHSHHKIDSTSQAPQIQVNTNTMTATRQCIPHNGLQLIDENHPHRRSYPTSTRTRSRAIAIKRPTVDEEKEEIRQNSLQAEYDWATWRMYNRIIDHRQKHPIPYTFENDDHDDQADLTSSETSVESTSTTIYDNENREEEFQVQQQQQRYYPEYGEVFDLDL